MKSSIINHKSSMSIILLVMMMFASCNFLERKPWDSVDTTNGFVTEADAVAAVNACYQPLQWPKLYNMRIWTLDIIAGESVVGAGGGSDGLETVEMSNFIATSDNFAALDLWRGPAPGILRCNFVLANVPQMDIDNDIKARLLGEAYFLRAHYYFILVRLFGGVPMPTEPLTADSELKMKRASVADIYALITEDLNQAISLLPTRSKYGSKDIGRATKEAAMVELARVYLTYEPDNAKYKEVVRICEEVGAMGYQLAANYADNFNPAKQNGVESIFVLKKSFPWKENFAVSPFLKCSTTVRRIRTSGRMRTKHLGSVRIRVRVTQVWQPVAMDGINLLRSLSHNMNPEICART